MSNVFFFLSFFLVLNKEILQVGLNFFACLKAHPISFELCCKLCCLSYIFQVLKIYIIRKLGSDELACTKLQMHRHRK